MLLCWHGCGRSESNRRKHNGERLPAYISQDTDVEVMNILITSYEAGYNLGKDETTQDLVIHWIMNT